ncbi:MAG: FAD-dependent oxidoreductase [Pseudomonadota bacterium]
MTPQKIAIIGGGIAGLASAWLLSRKHDVTLFERNDYIGGHTHTLEVDTPRGPLAVDTGFIVYNEPNYPNLTNLFRTLDVATRASDMSFGVSVDQGALEYAGSNLNTLFAQRRNLLEPRFLGMLRDVLRFNRRAKQILAQPVIEDISLGDFLLREAYGAEFRDHYLLPMAAAIWSCPTATMLAFPLASFLRFFANHKLIDLFGRPEWRTVVGGSHEYVKRMLRLLEGRVFISTPAVAVTRLGDAVAVIAGDGEQRCFDQVILACHADEALALLSHPSEHEKKILGSFSYQKNHAILHRDARLMPRNPRAWSSWNYLAQRDRQQVTAVSVTYWMNRLQGLPGDQQLFVSLNAITPPREDAVLREMVYDHPVFDQRAMTAQRQLTQIQGRNRIWYCGSYCGYGFHEDALRSAIAVAEQLGVTAPWASTQRQPSRDAIRLQPAEA